MGHASSQVPGWSANAVEASGRALGQGAAVTIEWSGWALGEARQRLVAAAQSEQAQELKATARRQAAAAAQRTGHLAKQAAAQVGKGARTAISKLRTTLRELRTPPADPPASSQ
jgi:signal transduction histidine kinase